MRLVVLVVAAALATALTVSAARDQPRRAGANTNRAGQRAGNTEVSTDGSLTAERLNAFAAAKAAGKVGKVAATTAPARGWVGSRLLNPATDDWEPAVAADPSAPY